VSVCGKEKTGKWKQETGKKKEERVYERRGRRFLANPFSVRVVLFCILLSETIVDVPSGGLYVLIEFPILLYFVYVTNYIIMW
jgi:hypothetical protein